MNTYRIALTTLVVKVFLLSINGVCDAQSPVEPLLQKYCLGCHNETDREGGLSLQTLESLKKGGQNGPVLLKEDLPKSPLLSVLNIESENAMPPEGEAQPTDAERDRLRRWVLNGAEIQSMAAGQPNVPTVKPFAAVNVPFLSTTVSSNSKQIVAGGSRIIVSTNVDDGKEKWRVSAPGNVSSLSFVQQDKWIVAATGLPGIVGKAIILSAEDGRVVQEFTAHTDAIYSAVMNSTGTLLATAGYDRRIMLHEVETGRVVRTLEGHNGSVFSLAFDPSGKVLCSASADSTVKVWNVETGERLDTLSQPGGEQYTVVVSKDGQRIYAAGADNRIRIWKLLSRDSVKINPQLTSRFAHEQTINRLTISTDGSLLASAAEDGSINVWQAWPLKHRQALPQQSASVTALAFIGTSKLFITRLNGTTETLTIAPDNKQPTIAGKTVAVTEATETLPDKLNEAVETEDNNAVDSAQHVTLPVVVSGVIAPDGDDESDADCFRFSAKSGQQLLLEVHAQQNKSPLDSRIEVLTPDGRPVMQTRLQAVRDSYFTFRGKDSTTVDDFRVFNWQEMELNQYLYADGEVVKLWLYPRGPDSGYKVYPGFGHRHTYFGTTATSHALQAPCFIVVPKSPEEPIIANGLPSFPVYYENDDDGRREIGSDSRLYFTAPNDGDFVVRLTDARGFSGTDYKYKLTVRAPRPSYTISMDNRKISVQPGTGREIVFTAKRVDGFNGPINIDAQNLPKGFHFSGPVVIQEEQLRAYGTIYADADAKVPASDDVNAVKFISRAESVGTVEIGSLTELKLLTDPKLRIRIGRNREEAGSSVETPVTIQIRPGQTVRASLQLERIHHDGVVSLGKEDAGRNLPHGVFVDNIGLNGLLLLENQSERDFFITAADWVPPTKVPFYLKANVDGITSLPVMLEVLPGETANNKTVAAAEAE